MNPIDFAILGYIAAFVDGEGTISLSGRPGVQVVIYNTYKPTLEWIQGMFGGQIHVNKKAGETSPGSKYKHTKDVYELRFQKITEMFAFLSSILPHLREKQDRAREALNVLRSKRELFLRTTKQ